MSSKSRFFASCAVAAALASALGCGPEAPARRVRSPRGAASSSSASPDAWAGIPHSAEWLVVTADTSGPHKAECVEVARWIEGEKACRARSCVHARDLAREWTDRCARLVPDKADGVRAAERAFADAVAVEATTCGDDAEAMRRDGCGADATCEITAERWAARCGKTDGTPLVVRLVERAVERRLSEPRRVKLDLRDCATLRQGLVAAAACAQPFACEAELGKVEAYRRRCESDELRPSLGVAVNELAIESGAGKPAPPIKVQKGSTTMARDEAQVVLAGGVGAVLSICDERPADVARYVALRQSCKDGQIVVAKSFVTASREVEARVGTLDFASDADFAARHPSLAAAGEAEARDRAALAAFSTELDRISALASVSSTLPDAVRALVRAAHANAPGLRRSPQMRGALAAHDEALVPVMREIAKRKAAAAKARASALDVATLAARAETRAFADVGLEGVVAVGVATRGEWLETAPLLPRGMMAYREPLRGLLASARARRGETNVAALGRAVEQAKVCGLAEREISAAGDALVACGFGVDRCDPEKAATLARAVLDARAAVESAWHEVVLATTGQAAASADEIAKAVAASGCHEPGD